MESLHRPNRISSILVWGLYKLSVSYINTNPGSFKVKAVQNVCKTTQGHLDKSATLNPNLDVVCVAHGNAGCFCHRSSCDLHIGAIMGCCLCMVSIGWTMGFAWMGRCGFHSWWVTLSTKSFYINHSQQRWPRAVTMKLWGPLKCIRRPLHEKLKMIVFLVMGLALYSFDICDWVLNWILFHYHPILVDPSTQSNMSKIRRWSLKCHGLPILFKTDLLEVKLTQNLVDDASSLSDAAAVAPGAKSQSEASCSLDRPRSSTRSSKSRRHGTPLTPISFHLKYECV
jgi:hypothetical protein